MKRHATISNWIKIQFGCVVINNIHFIYIILLDLRFFQSIFQIFDQIVNVFKTNRQSNQIISNAQNCSLFSRYRCMRHDRSKGKESDTYACKRNAFSAICIWLTVTRQDSRNRPDFRQVWTAPMSAGILLTLRGRRSGKTIWYHYGRTFAAMQFRAVDAMADPDEWPSRLAGGIQGIWQWSVTKRCDVPCAVPTSWDFDLLGSNRMAME